MTTNPTYKPSEGKREEFRRYLEKTGVMDALTKGLVSLYEEPDKPTDALHYLVNKLCTQSDGVPLDDLKNQLQEANNKVTQLESEIEQLRVGATSGEDQPADGAATTPPDEVPAGGADAAPADPPAAEAPPQES